MDCSEMLFSDHAIIQMFKRDISVDNIKLVVARGEVITNYLYDRPFPSYLILGYIDKRPIHVLIGEDTVLARCIIITAYEPDRSIWKEGFRLKKN